MPAPDVDEVAVLDSGEYFLGHPPVLPPLRVVRGMSGHFQHAWIEAKSAKQIFQRPHILNPLIARIPAGVDPAFGPSAPTVRANPKDEVVRRGLCLVDLN